jgi:hypothetical protein
VNSIVRGFSKLIIKMGEKMRADGVSIWQETIVPILVDLFERFYQG